MKHPIWLTSAMLTAGILILLYPAISDWQQKQNHSRQILEYQYQISSMEDGETAAILEEARRHNRGQSSEGYEMQLDPVGSGMMGIIEIPAICCTLPIYHGTGEAVLERAVGHIPWSSLPVGEAGSHCVLSGHRGLPGAKLFRDLDELAVGDMFFLHILGQTYSYRVDQILVVQPWETDPLKPVEGQDCCTLVTCTPYGINSRRLLVRGCRAA